MRTVTEASDDDSTPRRQLPPELIPTFDSPDAALLADIARLVTIRDAVCVARQLGEKHFLRASRRYCKEHVALEDRIAITPAQTSAGARAKINAVLDTLHEKPLPVMRLAVSALKDVASFGI